MRAALAVAAVLTAVATSGVAVSLRSQQPTPSQEWQPGGFPATSPGLIGGMMPAQPGEGELSYPGTNHPDALAVEP